MEFSEEDVQEAFDRLDKLDQISPDLKRMLFLALKKIRNGENRSEVLGFSPKIIEELVEHTNNLFLGGKYQKALEHYQFLQMLEPIRYEHVYSMATCYFYLDDYDRAIQTYMACTEIAPLSPLPHVQLSNCYSKQGYPETALAEIIQAIGLAELDNQYAGLKEKAEVERKYLENEIVRKWGGQPKTQIIKDM
jgi:tetratricopeptide (TPR) repeat protein